MEQTPSQAEVGEGGETKSVHPSQYSRMPQEQPTSQNVAAGPGLMGRAEIKQPGFLKECAAECLGTFLLVFVGCGSCTVVQSTYVAGMEVNTNNHVPIAICFGLTVASIAQAIGHISGAHLNPAVSIGLVAAGYCGLMKALFFTLAQCVGAILGAFFLWLAVGWKERATLGQTVVSFVHRGQFADAGWQMVEYFQAILIEMIITYILVLVVCGVCDKLRSDVKGSAVLAIGLSITAGHLFAVPLTGASMNTARSLGPNLISWVNYLAVNNTAPDKTSGLILAEYKRKQAGIVSLADMYGQVPTASSRTDPAAIMERHAKDINAVPGNAPMQDLWVYLVGPPVGGLLAGLTYRFLFREKPKPQENQ